MQNFSWRELLFSSSGLWGLFLMYHAAEWFWTGQALTASTSHIHHVVAQGVIGFAFVLGGTTHTVLLARAQERQRAEMIAELRAGRALSSAPPSDSLEEIVPARREEEDATSRANGA